MSEQTIGEGITVTVDGDDLLIAIDLSSTIGFSQRGLGKSMRYATSNGNASIVHKGGIIKLGINCYRDPTIKELAVQRKLILEAESEVASG